MPFCSIKREENNVFKANHVKFSSFFFRFCVGDRFFLCDNKILCEYDYEERMVFANLAYNSGNLAQIKQQARGAVSGGPQQQGKVRVTFMALLF